MDAAPQNPARLLDEAARRFSAGPAAGLQLLRSAALLRRPFDPGMDLLVLPEFGPEPDARDPEFEPLALPGRHAHAADAPALLRSLYPAEHPVHGLDGAADTTIGRLTPEALAAGPWLIRGLAPRDNLASPHALPWLVARLRAPGGCPWDREQDHLSLRPFLLEEAYEVYDALEQGSTPALAEELGDLLLQVVLHTHYGAEAGVFDMTDVIRATMAKIIRRHPHVFGDVVAGTAEEVVRNWEQIKAGERSERTADVLPDMPQAFAGLSRSLPALAYAQEMQARAAALGYDWPSVDGVIQKVAEEAAELAAADDDGARREELGDLLLVVVNLARHLGIDAEAALRSASAKFAARFAAVERIAAERGVELRGLTLAELDELWRQAKSGSLEAAR
ncbi:MAG TPA: nucleoside triphosphate pyrophosphohydrolase [Candidatus Limnocylindrales bacterium]|jgi:MazG family protein|nr:nucleoside triphosphate pyrophosphohydrolase [Candidatus Limnocylindrales bacterium]